MKITTVIITLNEEQNIERCLASVKDFSDEIVVIDSLSTDKTEEICAGFGLRFIKQEWLGYSGQKNFGNEMASNDWIFSIDADEEVSDELKKSILELKKQDVSEDKAFVVNRLTNYCGKWIRHCGWYPDSRIRLWNRKNGSWVGDIHEVIEFQGEIEKITLKGELHHYSYKNIEDHIRIANKYTTLIAQDRFKKGKRSSFVKRYLSPPFAFVRDFIFKGGFLDGKRGFAICRINAFSTYLKYIKLWELENESKK